MVDNVTYAEVLEVLEDELTSTAAIEAAQREIGQNIIGASVDGDDRIFRLKPGLTEEESHRTGVLVWALDLLNKFTPRLH